MLNRWCLHRDEAEFDIPDFENAAAEDAAWKDRLNPDLQWPLSAPWHYRVVPSWEHIFDLEAMEQLAGDEVQATFERLELADVVAVTEFAARQVRWE